MRAIKEKQEKKRHNFPHVFNYMAYNFGPADMRLDDFRK